MAKSTPTNYRNLVIYEIFTRAHSRQGTFREVMRDLPRIKALGVDVIWLMPHSPHWQNRPQRQPGQPVLHCRLFRHQSRIWHTGGFHPPDRDSPLAGFKSHAG